MGTSVRQTSVARSVFGVANGTGLGAGAKTSDERNEEDDGAESSRSDEAQQPSASAWLITRFAPCSSESDLCIGHGSSPVQQAIRASGVGSQPAQTAALPAIKPRHTRTAERRSMTTNLKDA